jgi:putative tricarboxylic transport membrane protein
MNLMKPLGFVPAAAMLFLSVAFAFGSRSVTCAMGRCCRSCAAAYFSFTRLLGLQLPGGPLAGLF